MTDNQRKATVAANDALIRQCGTATMRWGGARSYFWLGVYNRELERLEKEDLASQAQDAGMKET